MLHGILGVMDGAVEVRIHVQQIEPLGLKLVKLAAVVGEVADGIRAHTGGDGQQHADELAHHVEGGVLRFCHGLHVHERGNDAEPGKDAERSHCGSQQHADAPFGGLLIAGQQIIQLALEFACQQGSDVQHRRDGDGHQHGHCGQLVEQALGVEVDSHQVGDHEEDGQRDSNVVQQAALDAALVLDLVELFGHIGVVSGVHIVFSLSRMVCCVVIRLPDAGSLYRSLRSVPQ